MRWNRRASIVALVVAWVVPAAAPAAQLVPLGPEVDVPSDIFTGTPLVAAQAGGDFVVAWDHDCSPPFSIVYEFFAAGDSPTREGAIDGVDADHEGVALDSIVATPLGFDILWHPCGESWDSPPTAFYRTHLDRQGVAEGEPVRVSGSGTRWIWQLHGGGVLAGWPLSRRHAISARRLDATGLPLGPVLSLNSRPVDAPEPVVVPFRAGGFAAVWLGTVPGSGGRQVLRARRFSPTGAPRGGDFDVNTLAGAVGGLSAWYPFAVAPAPGGGFAVAWMLDHTLYLRLFDNAARPLGPEAVVVSGTEVLGPQSMAFDPAGNLLLLWGIEHLDLDPEDNSQLGPDLRIQLFDRRGRPLAPPAEVGSEPIDEVWPWEGRVAWAGSSWVVTWWASLYPFDQGGVFLRRFAFDGGN
jgi:hypothetical protein